MRRYSSLLMAIVVVLVLLGSFALGSCLPGIGAPRAVQVQSVPALKNPDMEGSFRYVDGVGELMVANDWEPWYLNDPGSLWYRPEYKAEHKSYGAGRVYEGTWSQKLFTTFAKHDAGLRQEVYGVVPGEWYKFSAIGYQWSSQQDDPGSSANNGKCSFLTGINPWGDTNALVRTTVWGKEQLNVYNKWVTAEVTAQAWADKIVVFTRQVCEFPVKHNDLYHEGMRLEKVSIGTSPSPTPEDEPTKLPPSTPVVVDIDYDQIRQLIREELDKTKITISGE